MFRLLCFAIIRLLHYLLDTYMCKTIGWDILVISSESVAGNVVGMIRIITEFISKWICSYILLLNATLVYCADLICSVFTNIIDICGTIFSKVSNVTATSHQANMASSCLFTPELNSFPSSTNFNTVLIVCTPGFVLQQVFCRDSSKIRKQI
jgi:hypothetical protein